jgi:hypothetical protein
MAKSPVKKITKAQALKLAAPHVEYLASIGHDAAQLQAVEKVARTAGVSFLAVLGVIAQYLKSNPAVVSIIIATMATVAQGGFTADTLRALLSQFAANPDARAIVTAILALLGVTVPAGI